MSDAANRTFRIDVRNARSLAAFNSRISRFNHQEPRAPDVSMPNVHINVSNDPRFRTAGIYNSMLDAINTNVITPTGRAPINTTAGTMNLLVQAFVQPTQPHVYVISVGQGG